MKKIRMLVIAAALFAVADVFAKVTAFEIGASSGYPGCDVGWRLEYCYDDGSYGTCIYRYVDTTFTIWRDDVAIATVSNVSGYRDYDVELGKTYTYRVTAMGASTKSVNCFCYMDYTLEVDESPLLFSPDGGEKEVTAISMERQIGNSKETITSRHYTGEWNASLRTVQCSESWVTAQHSYNAGILTVTAKKNTSGTTRTATITLTDYAYHVKTITVRQSAEAGAVFADWAEMNGVGGELDDKTDGVANAFRYVFDVPSGDFEETPLIDVAFEDGKVVVKTPPVVNEAGVTVSVVESSDAAGKTVTATKAIDTAGSTEFLKDSTALSRFYRLSVDVAD